MSKLRSEFVYGMESARIKSHRGAIGRALLLTASVLIAGLCVGPWWGKILTFLILQLIIGAIASRRTTPSKDALDQPGTPGKEQ